MEQQSDLEFHFSTTGIRGKVERDFTPEFTFSAGRAIAQWMKHNGSKTMVVGRDSRKTSDFLITSLISGLLYEGLDITLIVDRIPTPALIRYMISQGYNGGIIVTGSHLPPSDNGIIWLLGNGDYYRGKIKLDRHQVQNWERMGNLSFVSGYLEEYLSHLDSMIETLQLKKQHFKILVDTISGPMGEPMNKILTNLVDKVVHLNFEMDPMIKARPSEPKPETLNTTMDAFREGSFDFGITTDYDGDRVIYITGKGRILSGDYIGAIFAKYFWEANPKETVVIPINTSAIISDLAAKLGVEFEYCQVGAPRIIQKMRETNAVFGFEETGKYFFRDFNLYPDSLATTIFLLHIMDSTGKTLDELAEEFPRYYQLKRKTPSSRAVSSELMGEIEKHLNDFVSDLGDEFQIRKIHTMDGIRIDFSNGSWILLRQSGTEDNMRVFTESQNEKVCNYLNEKGISFVRKIQENLKLL